mmetsp:Transcript_8538/g.17034  ORF Transcript_8538/g.17034 Transcript_8538/m.17034 type:complete len:128 (+) Transcript_8538:909-1292(+)
MPWTISTLALPLRTSKGLDSRSRRCNRRTTLTNRCQSCPSARSSLRSALQTVLVPLRWSMWRYDGGGMHCGFWVGRWNRTRETNFTAWTGPAQDVHHLNSVGQAKHTCHLVKMDPFRSLAQDGALVR